MSKVAPLIAAIAALTGCSTLPASEPQLTGTAWEIVSIDGAPAVSRLTRVDFLDNRLAATVGCNRMGASVIYKPDRLTVGPVMATRMYCDKLMEQEAAFGQLLEAGPRFNRARGVLHLEGGNHRAELREVPPRKI